MRFSTVSALAFVAAAAAQNQNHTVQVGNGGLTFTPNTVNAAVGDIITFTFYPKNHTLTQSSFATPCTAAFDAATGQAGFDTNFVPVASGTSAPMSIRVTTTTPLWFFCRQATHCQSGMVFAVNPTANKTFAQFQANAMAQAPLPGQTAAPAAAPPAQTGATPGGAAPSAAPGAAAPSPAAPGGASIPPAASAPGAGVDTTDSSPYGAAPTDSGSSATLGLPGLGSTNTGSAPGSTSTGKPNGAVTLSPRSVVFAMAGVFGAALLL